MSRPSSIVILCEDDEHRDFVRRLLPAKVLRGNLTRTLRVIKVEGGRGAGTKLVYDHYAREVQARRTRHAVTWLIVITDADGDSTPRVRARLESELRKAELEERGASEPVAILVPKREIETWILHLLGEVVTEDQQIDNSSVRRALRGLAKAAEALATNGPPETPLPSLAESWSDYRSHILERDD